MIARSCLIFILILSYFFIACEEVIDVDVPTEDPRLIVNALVRVDTSVFIDTYGVRVGLTDSFFGEIPVTNLKQITLAGKILVDINNPGSGIYEAQGRPTDFTNREGELLLQIDWEDKLYYAATEYVPTVQIDTIEIGSRTLLDTEQTEVIVTFTDNPDRTDFYVFDFGFGNFATLDDQFIQGQQFSLSYFYDQKFESGQELTISILGADQSFFNYMNLLIEQTENDFGVFETPAATARGNIFDVTELDNIDFFDNVLIPNEFPLGYFAVVQEFKKTLVIP